MLQPTDPLMWWQDFINSNTTAAEARNYLSLGAYEWLGIPGLGTAQRMRVHADIPPAHQELSHTEVLRLFAREYQPTMIKVVSLERPDLFRRWLAAERPEHLEHFDAAIAARAIGQLR